MIGFLAPRSNFVSFSGYVIPEASFVAWSNGNMIDVPLLIGEIYFLVKHNIQG